MRLSAEAPEGETFDIENDCEAAGPKFSGIKPPGHNFLSSVLRPERYFTVWFAASPRKGQLLRL